VLSIAVGSAFQLLLPWLGAGFHLLALARLLADRCRISHCAFGGIPGYGLVHSTPIKFTTLTNVVSVCVLVVAQVLLLPVAGLHGAGGAICHFAGIFPFGANRCFSVFSLRAPTRVRFEPSSAEKSSQRPR